MSLTYTITKRGAPWAEIDAAVQDGDLRKAFQIASRIECRTCRLKWRTSRSREGSSSGEGPRTDRQAWQDAFGG